MKILWTAEQIDRLKEFAGKLPARDIGKKIGRTKSAVIAKSSALGLPRFEVILTVKSTPTKKTEPLIARFKNHEAAARVERRAVELSRGPSRIEWCPQCFSPVSNWEEHLNG